MLSEWLRGSAERMEILRAVRMAGPDQSFVAAGAVRNLAWDRLHGYEQASPLNDVDAVYYDSSQLSPEAEKEAESDLRALLPDVRWQVRNQAGMNARNGEPPYPSTARAMQAWPETATAVGVRLLADETFDWICPWGSDDLFALLLRPSPLCRRPGAFAERVRDKGWLSRWPKLKVVLHDRERRPN
jgi:hypothetical protein